MWVRAVAGAGAISGGQTPIRAIFQAQVPIHQDPRRSSTAIRAVFLVEANLSLITSGTGLFLDSRALLFTRTFRPTPRKTCSMNRTRLIPEATGKGLSAAALVSLGISYCFTPKAVLSSTSKGTPGVMVTRRLKM